MLILVVLQRLLGSALMSEFGIIRALLTMIVDPGPQNTHKPLGLDLGTPDTGCRLFRTSPTSSSGAALGRRPRPGTGFGVREDCRTSLKRSV